MRGIRRKEKSIETEDEMLAIIEKAKYVTIAMCQDNEPYLVTLSHGLDRNKRCIYFHCAHEGKKIDILHANNTVWGQAIDDNGYVDGSCDHLYASTQFKGTVAFIKNTEEKEQALRVMIHRLENDPEKVITDQITPKSLKRVNIGRIDLQYMSGKKSKEVIISL
jgi:nitroimidazol reductase NimA-like FMN-containing flavoprotein (pyridoxamine 5'-phosphate oxidase superfamily)